MAATTKIPARDWTFELNTGTTGSPTWVAVGGLNSWGHSPKANDADTTTFDDAGRMSHMKASRGDEFTLSGLYKEDVDTGERDPGQEAVEAWANVIGVAATKEFRITSPGGTAKKFQSSATVTIGGGGNDDATKWEAALVVDGAIETL
jgi:hypothetical protein